MQYNFCWSIILLYGGMWWDVVDVVDVVERAGESLFYLRMDSLCRACMGGVVLEYAQIVVK